MVLHKKIGHKRISPEDFEHHLCSAVNAEKLQNSNLFKDLSAWEYSHNIFFTKHAPENKEYFKVLSNSNINHSK